MYLKGQLAIPGVKVRLNVKDPKSVTYETEGPGLTAAAKGKIDAFLAAEPVGKARIAEGVRVRQLPEIAFTYFPAGFVDKNSGLSAKPFVEKVNAIIQAAEQDGTLKKLSLKYFGRDYVAQAAGYDINGLNQKVK
jgi:ABC-type amino acid transport substrate-binding protein